MKNLSIYKCLLLIAISLSVLGCSENKIDAFKNANANSQRNNNYEYIKSLYSHGVYTDFFNVDYGVGAASTPFALSLNEHIFPSLNGDLLLIRNSKEVAWRYK